jgi:hypothetical protein
MQPQNTIAYIRIYIYENDRDTHMIGTNLTLESQEENAPQTIITES